MPKNNTPSITDLRKKYGTQSDDHMTSQPAIVQQLAEVIAPYFDLRPSDIFIPRRVRSIVDARQVLMFALHRGCDFGLSETGRITVLGGANHTTVIHACNVIGHVGKSVQNVADALDEAVRMARAYNKSVKINSNENAYGLDERMEKCVKFIIHADGVDDLQTAKNLLHEQIDAMMAAC